MLILLLIGFPSLIDPLQSSFLCHFSWLFSRLLKTLWMSLTMLWKWRGRIWEKVNEQIKLLQSMKFFRVFISKFLCLRQCLDYFKILTGHKLSLFWPSPKNWNNHVAPVVSSWVVQWIVQLVWITLSNVSTTRARVVNWNKKKKIDQKGTRNYIHLTANSIMGEW